MPSPSESETKKFLTALLSTLASVVSVLEPKQLPKAAQRLRGTIMQDATGIKIDGLDIDVIHRLDGYGRALTGRLDADGDMAAFPIG